MAFSDSEDFELEENEMKLEESPAEAVQYPWPFPDNWPLPTPAETKSIESECSTVDFEDEELDSPTKLTFAQAVPAVYARPTSFRRQSTFPGANKFGSENVRKPSPIVEISGDLEEDPPISFDQFAFTPSYHSSPTKSRPRSIASRSITSTTSSRRRDRVSIIETFHRKQSQLEEIVEKKLNFPAEFRTRRITEAKLKPWVDVRDPRKRMITFIPYLGLLLGVLIGGYLIYTGWHGVPKHKFCLVLNEDWSNGIDDAVWSREVNLGGFGTSEFEWATNSENNSYVRDGQLFIVPTLTEDAIGAEAVENGYTVDLTLDGSCTGTTAKECMAVSNSTEGTIIPPVQSARLITKGKFSMKYGKIEVKARMPKGDWIWPAIWMLPENDVYGAWPLSGEIDIAEGRGNSISYPSGGRNIVSSTLHWGPSSGQDAFYRTSNNQREWHSDYASDFYTFGLEWTEDYLYTYVNNHLRQVFYIKFDETFFKRGQWPAIDATNKTAIANPWAAAKNLAAPFDQEFYIILNVAVGTSQGYFPDGIGNKPWVDGTATAKADFYSAKDTWYPTWGTGEDRAMVVDSVKAWEICD